LTTFSDTALIALSPGCSKIFCLTAKFLPLYRAIGYKTLKATSFFENVVAITDRLCITPPLPPQPQLQSQPQPRFATSFPITS
jgi:hypothetical protein